MDFSSLSKKQFGKIKHSIIAMLIIFVMLLGACGPGSEAISDPVVTPVQAQTGEPPASTPVPTITPKQTAQPISTSTPVPTPSPVPTLAVSFIGQAVCTAKDAVNIRENPDKNSAVLASLPADETADVIAYEGDWAYISYNGITGYVSRDYLIGRHKPGIDVPMGEWAAILVNPSHLLPDGFSVAVADFEGGQVDARIYDICGRMFDDAAKDGVEFKLVDAYRSLERQSELYQQKVESYIAKGYSREDAESQAATITARPNTSEHQTGLALDIVTSSYTKRDKGFAKTDAFMWLNANAQDYGFTMRYKQDKREYTKVIYEPWHWRFVGVEAAKAMKQSGECFEEYTDATE